MRSWFVVLALLAVACGDAKSAPTAVSTTLAAAVNEDGLAIVVCDKVVSYGAPTAAAAGSLVLANRGWTLARDAELSHTELLVKDADVCVHLRFDENQIIEQCDVEAAPTEDPWSDGGTAE